MMLLLILWATLVGHLVTVKADSCFAQNQNPYMLFSTYTPYKFVHENTDDPVHIPREYCFHNLCF
jgi:hypothetical protein